MYFQTDDFGYLYGLALDTDEEGNKLNTGDISCRLKGTYIGPHNIETYISNYGKSRTDNNIVHVDSLGQPFVFHTLADIDSISASTGSDNGGQYLTITGDLLNTLSF